MTMLPNTRRERDSAIPGFASAVMLGVFLALLPDMSIAQTSNDSTWVSTLMSADRTEIAFIISLLSGLVGLFFLISAAFFPGMLIFFPRVLYWFGGPKPPDVREIRGLRFGFAGLGLLLLVIAAVFWSQSQP